MMKRYMLFGFDRYYPGGGWCDFIADFEDKADAIALADRYIAGKVPMSEDDPEYVKVAPHLAETLCGWEFVHVVDTQAPTTDCMVYKGKRG